MVLYEHDTSVDKQRSLVLMVYLRGLNLKYTLQYMADRIG